MADLVDKIIEFSRTHPRPKSDVRLFAAVEDEMMLTTGRRSRQQVQIVSLPDGGFRVLHPQMEKAADRYDLSQEENVARFTRLLRKYRVEELLVEAGAAEGSSVAIGHMAFDFHPDENMHTVPDPVDEGDGSEKEQTN